MLEDHKPTLAILAWSLGRQGHQVVTADSVSAALAAAQQGEFDILLSDLGLPDGTGQEAMDQLRKLQPSLLGVALSGYGMPEDIQRSSMAGFADDLIKPIDVDELRRVLHEVMAATWPPRN